MQIISKKCSFRHQILRNGAAQKEKAYGTQERQTFFVFENVSGKILADDAGHI